VLSLTDRPSRKLFRIMLETTTLLPFAEAEIVEAGLHIRGLARASMHFKLAILTALARRPDGRATLEEISREVEVLTASEDQAQGTEELSPVGDIDIFQSGLVVPEGHGLQITDAGRSLLDALETFTEPSLPPVSSSSSRSLKPIDDLIGTGRLKIFDLELKKPDEQTDLSSHQQQASDGCEDVKMSAADAGIVVENQAEIDASQDSHRADPDQTVSEISRPIAIDPADRTAPDAPAFLIRSFGSELQMNAPNVSRRESLFKAIAARLERTGRIWRGHLVQDVPNTTAARRTAGIGGGMFAILTVLVVTICTGALVALTQIKTLKTEIASLKRELLPLRERLTRYDQAEKAKEAEIKAATEKSKALTPIRSEQASLTFSREEVQLIRDYIKPAPFAGIASPAINVGDPIGAMIPLPSPLMEKVPKLRGARFTTRNGAIIISVKNSRRADAVLAPN